jgi:hypothetical protein
VPFGIDAFLLFRHRFGLEVLLTRQRNTKPGWSILEVGQNLRPARTEAERPDRPAKVDARPYNFARADLQARQNGPQSPVVAAFKILSESFNASRRIEILAARFLLIHGQFRKFEVAGKSARLPVIVDAHVSPLPLGEVDRRQAGG